MNAHYILITVSLCALSVLTRVFPFWMAKFMTENFNKMGKLLPAYIMLLLVIYEINPETITTPPYGLPALMALIVVTLMHVWFRNTLITLAIGTTSFMFLTHLL